MSEFEATLDTVLSWAPVALPLWFVVAVIFGLLLGRPLRRNSQHYPLAEQNTSRPRADKVLADEQTERP